MIATLRWMILAAFWVWTLLLLALWVGSALAQAPCTHWAAANGTGSTCTQAQPCQVASWWPLAGPGTTLCLMDGTYRGAASMLIPPPTLRGTPSQPITVRALNDGKVTLDAQHAGPAVVLAGDWWVVAGINATNGLQRIYGVSGSHNLLRRVIGWDGTARQENSYPFDIGGIANRVEDAAGWGINARKIFNQSQAGDVGGGGFTRTWGEWNGHPMGPTAGPSNTYQLGYNTTNQRWENVIGTWNLRGEHKDAEGSLGAFYNGSESGDMAGTKILGGIFYAAQGTNYSASLAVQTINMRNVYFENVLAVLAPQWLGKAPFLFLGCAPGQCSGNVCKDCLSIHAGIPSVNADGSGWTLPGWREGRGVEAATGGRSPFELLPMLCNEVVGGVLTQEKLWPWKMDTRIRDARIASGYPPVTVTTDIEALLGPIPAACRRSPTPEPPAPSDGVLLTCTGVARSEAIAVACVKPPEGAR